MKKPAPEPEIESLEEFRRVLVRRLSDLNGNWRICDQRVCRRLRTLRGYECALPGKASGLASSTQPGARGRGDGRPASPPDDSRAE